MRWATGVNWASCKFLISNKQLAVTSTAHLRKLYQQCDSAWSHPEKQVDAKIKKRANDEYSTDKLVRCIRGSSVLRITATTIIPHKTVVCTGFPIKFRGHDRVT